MMQPMISQRWPPRRSYWSRWRRPPRRRRRPGHAAKPAARTWTAPKTPWGDPDIQGVWTSDSVRGIPTQRPAELAGKAELSDEEFAKKVERDEQTRKTAENAEGAFRNDGAWLQRSFNQTSLITEPADGRFPPLTRDAQKRAAPRDRGSFGEGPFWSYQDFTLYDRCITRGIVGSILPVVYGNGNRILQTPGQVVISYEMMHDTRVIPLDGRPHIGSEDPAVPGRLARPLGGQYAGGRDDEPHRRDEHRRQRQRTAAQRRHEDRRALHAHRGRTCCSTRSRSTIRKPTRGRSRSRFRCSRRPASSCCPTSATKATTCCATVLSGERTEDKALEEDAKKGIIRPRKGVQQGLDAGARPLPGTAGGEGGPRRGQS